MTLMVWISYSIGLDEGWTLNGVIPHFNSNLYKNLFCIEEGGDGFEYFLV